MEDEVLEVEHAFAHCGRGALDDGGEIDWRHLRGVNCEPVVGAELSELCRMT